MNPIADPVNFLERILAARRLAPKTKMALLFVLVGESYRLAAQRAGVRDHMQVYLAAKRLGFTDLHLQRRGELQRCRELEWQRRILASGHPSLRQLAQML